ncbi:calmodulin-binding protein 60 D-like [Magnolia sinica]|uniref:calmodulin-binding protein 60 D-like n=1 Tax=Magnolia sinica TaxID=86752 RepID=UPI0026596F9F|nr:calmodulin-binding protein 60 D-like [Magnolia sinica]
MLPGLVEQMLPGLVQQFLPEIVKGSQHCACKKQQYGKQVDKSASRSLQLKFKNKPFLPIFTNKKVEGEDSSDLTLELVDAVTGQVVNSGPESSMEVEIVVLDGDFKCNEDNNWEPEYFRFNIVSERDKKGKKNLLTGSVLLTLKEGVGVAHDIKITDNSKWIRSGEFRLGVRVEKGYFNGMRVKEAVTEQFVVREDHGKYYEKHYPPSLVDKVWRLENISEKGVFYNRLSNKHIFTVKDFLTATYGSSTAPRGKISSHLHCNLHHLIMHIHYVHDQYICVYI